MDRIIDNEIQHLLDANIGDAGRLEFIRECIQKDKSLYNSDRSYLLKIISKYSSDESVLDRLDYLNPISSPPQIIKEKPKSKNNTKIKILIIIAVTIVAYFVTHGALITACNAFFEDDSTCSFLYDLYDLTAIHIQVPGAWDTGDGIGYWSGTAEGMESQNVFLIKESLGFIFFFIIIPSFVILGIIIKGKRKNHP